MDKIAAMARNAELRGAMAAFVDAGLVKVASQEAFDSLVNAVDARMGAGDYNLEKVAAATDAVLASGGMRKTAAEGAYAALGELLMMKTAGQIDNATFTANAQELMKLAATAGDLAAMYEAEGRKVPAQLQRQVQLDEMRALEGRKIPDNVRLTGGGARGADLGKYVPHVEPAPGRGGKILDFVRRNKKGLAIGGGLAAAGLGGTYLAKQLYDKYNAPEVAYGA